MPSHGSLTKAGKVRSQTPKIPAKPKKNLAPRIRNRKDYIMFLARKLASEVVAVSRKTGLPYDKVIDSMISSETKRERIQALRVLKDKPELLRRRH